MLDTSSIKTQGSFSVYLTSKHTKLLFQVHIFVKKLKTLLCFSHTKDIGESGIIDTGFSTGIVKSTSAFCKVEAFPNSKFVSKMFNLIQGTY